MKYFSALACILLAGIVSAKQFEVMDGGKACIIVDLEGNLDITYPMGETTGKATVAINLGEVSSMSRCGESLVLNVTADETHLFTFNFANDGTNAVLSSVNFAYKLSDEAVFKSANLSAGADRTASNAVNLKLSKNTEYFSCSTVKIPMTVADHTTEMVDVDATGVKIQAFNVMNGTFSGNGEICGADTTTAAPTTAAPTTAAPTTTTTAKPPMTVSQFYVRNGTDGAYCFVLTATTFNVTCEGKVWMVNSNDTTFDGKCGDTDDEITIRDKAWPYSVTLIFGLSGSNYHLNNASITMDKCMGDKNGISDDLRAPKSNVYRCNTAQTVTVTDNSTLVFEGVKLQAFRTSNTTDFSGTEYICMGDSNVSTIVPIAVGCALAGLIVIVLIAYIIGRLRRRPYEPV